MSYNWGFILGAMQVFMGACTCIGYAIFHDWKHALYWFFGAGITAVVTFWFQ